MKFTELNNNQKNAVEYVLGPSLILAGAGSGKTKVITSKATYLIYRLNINPDEICMVTFTNKAAEEMKRRIGQNIGFIGTFHSLCVRILRRQGACIDVDPFFTIYDDDDQKEIIKEIIKKYLDIRTSPSYFIDKISEIKNNLIDIKTYSKYVSGQHVKEFVDIFREYENFKKKNNALDFDDLLLKTVVLFKESKEALNYYHNKFKYILVDEFQDTNAVQYILSKQLAINSRNITVVGDFSQSIYSWRGADMMNLKKFIEDFPDAKTFYLLDNYRSTQNILTYAYKVISRNGSHPVLNLRSVRDKGEEVIIKEFENDKHEALYVASEIQRLSQHITYESIGVLYRTNAQSRSIEEAFLHYGIPYTLVGGTRFYQRKEIKDILSYLRLLVNPADEYAKKRAIKIGKKKFQKFLSFQKKAYKNITDLQTLDLIESILNETEYLSQFDERNSEDLIRLENIKELKSVAISYPNIVLFLEQIVLVESEYSESEKLHKNKKGVYLMTLHQAKGLEFSCVFIVGIEEGILPHVKSIYDEQSLEEERRLFYVGLTRAKDKLYLTHVNKRFFFGKSGFSSKSRFLLEAENFTMIE